MKEQSQIDEMRAAIRGDLERGRARRGWSPVTEPEPEPEPAPAQPSGDAPRSGLLRTLFKRR